MDGISLAKNCNGIEIFVTQARKTEEAKNPKKS